MLCANFVSTRLTENEAGCYRGQEHRAVAGTIPQILTGWHWASREFVHSNPPPVLLKNDTTADDELDVESNQRTPVEQLPSDQDDEPPGTSRCYQINDVGRFYHRARLLPPGRIEHSFRRCDESAFVSS
jgi:hypothetical protein